MIQWKQRLYAFLLRQVLGPFLDAASTQKLHDSIEFSLQEGTYVLKDIGLNAANLTEKIANNAPGLSIRRARIERLEIQLSLRENVPEGGDGSTSSLAWRAMKLGTTNSSLPAVSLVAEIRIHGVELELEPCHRQRPASPAAQQPDSPKTQDLSPDQPQQPSSKSIIGSYVDAALSSLQLSLKVTNISIKLCQQQSISDKEAWVAINMSSISFQDQDINNSGAKEGQKIKLNKLLEVSGVTILTGETHRNAINNCQYTLALAEGIGQVYVRIVECKTLDDKKHIEQDFDIKMNQQLNFSVDPASLQRIKTIADAFADISNPSDESDNEKPNPEPEYAQTTLANIPTEQEVDKEDLHAISGIMRQYREAYHLAEKNQLQRGMLVPSHAYLDAGVVPEDDDTTYDVFFDANDQSFYNTASVLMQSVQIAKEQPSSDDSGNFLSTKLRLHLMDACLKVVFREPKSTIIHGPEEYMLLTMNDLMCNLSSTNHAVEVSLSLSHLQVEDAQLNKSKSSAGFMSVGGSPVFEGTIEIGSLLEFVEQLVGDEEYENNLVVSQAPCISLHLKKSKPSANQNILECEVELLPIELFYRERTISNLSVFVSQLGNEKSQSRSTTVKPAANDNPEEENVRLTKFHCSCPSISFSAPLATPVEMQKMFDRCGVITNNVPLRSACLGVQLENIEIEWREEVEIVDGDTFPSQAGGKFSCHHLLVFAAAPVKNGITLESQMQRTDLCVATGRLEIDPYTPISIEFKRNLPGTQEGNCGKESFPVVPSLSTFKARQEDEDEDMKIDKMLFSKLQDVDADSRKELRGSDPQLQMMAEAERCDSIVYLNVPEVIVDLTNDEVETLLKMLPAIRSGNDSNVRKESAAVQSSSISPTNEDTQSSIGIATNFSQISISIRESPLDDLSMRGDIFSILLAVDELRTHSISDGAGLKQFRFLAFEPCLYSAHHYETPTRPKLADDTLQTRVSHFKQRILQYSASSLSPVLYRSHLFNPISHATPSLLLDFLVVPTPARSKSNLSQTRMHLTLYHLTYRYDVDSDWLQRVNNLIPKTEEQSNSGSMNGVPGKGKVQQQKSMMRVFVSVADLNIDYSSASYFETASRSIIRIGDFRFSSNVMEPAGKMQSYSISLGDFSYHVCAIKHSYSDENRKLCRADEVMGKSLKPMRRLKAESGPAAETLLREMKFVNVLSLDSLDAIIVKANANYQLGNNRMSRNPKTTISLTLGLLSVHACKDSFGCFASTVGEVQAKLTALTDKEVEALKEEATTKIPFEYPGNGQLPGEAIPRREDDFKTVIRGPKARPKEEEEKESIPLLLDGYDWTTIDHGPSNRVEIPDGDEQVAVWYDNDVTEGKPAGFPARLIHHHFPMHSLNDPLSDGDMGASTYGGKGADLKLKSRLLIHKLTVKLRFFDGYDWPEHLNAKQRSAAKQHKRFVIEPLPQITKPENKEPNDETKVEDNRSGSRSRKSQLLADLLEGGEDAPSTFASAPLPEERAANLEKQADSLRFSRKSNLFFQISANGVTVRIDSFEKTESTRLVSIMDVAVSDLFIAETASLCNPIKMLGEWVNDTRHPRDTRFGMMMMKMVTWSPLHKLTENGDIESDDCDVTVELLPTRCIIDQRAVTFVRAFFHSEESDDDEREKWNAGLHVLPPPRFRAFRVKPWKLKVDYLPQELNVTALRDGSLVELINVSPIDGMVITLSQVTVEDVVGFGLVLSGLLSSWVQEICATQLHKFLTNARPFEPISDVGQGITDLVVLPYEAFRNGDDIRRALQSGVKSLAETVVFQTLATSSRLTQYAASTLAGTVSDKVVASNPLPSRPFAPPRGVSDVTGHAAESLARGIQAANYRVVIVPYREYSRRGATGAATSIIKGIPVLLVAPLTGATEALSYTLLGARNALRPDLRKEEEATKSGFNSYDI